METRWIIVVVVIALLAGLVGGFLGVSPASGGAMMRFGQMMPPQMMTSQMMIDMCRQAMADPAMRAQMLEIHRQMHNEMERR